MALLGTSVLFSEVTGTVVRDGKPVAGVEVVRRIHRPQREPEELTTRTGADGSFHFPEATRSREITDFLPGDPLVRQELWLVVDGEERPGWLHFRRDNDRNSESQGRPFQLMCDLDADPGGEPGYEGVCRIR